MLTQEIESIRENEDSVDQRTECFQNKRQRKIMLTLEIEWIRDERQRLMRCRRKLLLSSSLIDADIFFFLKPFFSVLSVLSTQNIPLASDILYVGAKIIARVAKKK